jgi:hypothetical protein
MALLLSVEIIALDSATFQLQRRATHMFRFLQAPITPCFSPAMEKCYESDKRIVVLIGPCRSSFLTAKMRVPEVSLHANRCLQVGIICLSSTGLARLRH